MSARLARRLVTPEALVEQLGCIPPDFLSGPQFVTTYGPEVADVNAAAGFEPDPQQQLGLDLIFAIGSDLRPAAFAYAVVCCRQNMKTGLFKQAAIGWLYVTEQRLVVWSAHEMDTTRDAQRDLADLIKSSPSLRKRLKATPNEGIYDANGEERIELSTGQRIKFKARTLSGARGLTGDKVILDEAFALQPSHVGSLLPTMLTRPDAQVLYGSSAGKADSDVLRDVRDRGRAAASPRLAYTEWCAPKTACADPECEHPKSGASGCALDRVDLIEKANPTISTGRITLRTVLDLRQELPSAEFARECLGWWDEEGVAKVVALPGWFDLELAVTDSDGYDVERPEDGLVIGAAVGLDQEWASIAAAARWPDGRVNVGAVDRRRGTRWLVPELKRMQDEHQAPVVMDEKCPDAGLLERLEQACVEVTTRSLDEVAAAKSWLVAAVQEREVTHFGDTELDAAIRGAAPRRVGDRTVWGLRQSVADISMLNAATLAGHGVAEQLSLGAFNIY